MSKSDEEILREMKAVCEAEPLGRGFQDRWLRAAYRVARAHVLDEAAAHLREKSADAKKRAEQYQVSNREHSDRQFVATHALDIAADSLLALKDRTP